MHIVDDLVIDRYKNHPSVAKSHSEILRHRHSQADENPYSSFQKQIKKQPENILLGLSGCLLIC